MSRSERRSLKKRLQNATVETAKEFLKFSRHGDHVNAALARERGSLLFKASCEVDNFDFESD